MDHWEVTMLDNILETMRAGGWTQAMLTRETGLSKSMVNHLLNGNRRFTVRTLLTFADTLEVPLDHLLRKTDGKYISK